MISRENLAKKKNHLYPQDLGKFNLLNILGHYLAYFHGWSIYLLARSKGLSQVQR